MRKVYRVHFADYFPHSAHNHSMNMIQSRVYFLTTDHCAPEGTPTPYPPHTPRGYLGFIYCETIENK